MSAPKYRVIEKDMSGKPIRVIAKGKTEANAEAIVVMAVIRRGVDESFFAIEEEAPDA